jgi:hypothetical protein
MLSLLHRLKEPEIATLWFPLVWYPLTRAMLEPEVLATVFLSVLWEKVDCSALRIGKTYWLEGSMSCATPPVKAIGFSGWLKMPLELEVKGSNRLRE